MCAKMLNNYKKSKKLILKQLVSMIFLFIFSIAGNTNSIYAAANSLQNQLQELKDRQTICFLNTLEVHEKLLKKFVAANPKPSEAQKIMYLVQILRASKQIFIRNGSQFTGRQAADGMLWKMKRQQAVGHSYQTTEEFISRVATYSKTSGLPYEMLLENNEKIQLSEVLRNELSSLNAILAGLEYGGRELTASALSHSQEESMPSFRSAPSTSTPAQTSAR